MTTAYAGAMRVGTGVLHYRFWPEARETIDALLGQTRPPDELVVFDNGSGDGSPERIRDAYPTVVVRSVAANLGPSAGMNRVMDSVLDLGVDAVQLVPHDCTLAEDALEQLVARLEGDPRLGAVGPVLGYSSEPERLWSAGGDIHPRNWDTGHPRLAPTVSEAYRRAPYEVDWLDGSGILMRADAVERTGRYSEQFFYFFDEPDYHIRMRRLGWRLECVPAAAAWQEPGFPNPYMFVRNRLGFLARNAPRRVLARELLRVAFHLARDTIRPRSTLDRSEAWLRLRGAVDFARGRWGPPPASLGFRRSES